MEGKKYCVFRGDGGILRDCGLGLDYRALGPCFCNDPSLVGIIFVDSEPLEQQNLTEARFAPDDDRMEEVDEALPGDTHADAKARLLSLDIQFCSAAQLRAIQAADASCVPSAKRHRVADGSMGAAVSSDSTSSTGVAAAAVSEGDTPAISAVPPDAGSASNSR